LESDHLVRKQWKCNSVMTLIEVAYGWNWFSALVLTVLNIRQYLRYLDVDEAKILKSILFELSMGV
jgi:hypothetical protein